MEPCLQCDPQFLSQPLRCFQLLPGVRWTSRSDCIRIAWRPMQLEISKLPSRSACTKPKKLTIRCGDRRLRPSIWVSSISRLVAFRRNFPARRTSRGRSFRLLPDANSSFFRIIPYPIRSAWKLAKPAMLRADRLDFENQGYVSSGS